MANIVNNYIIPSRKVAKDLTWRHVSGKKKGENH